MIERERIAVIHAHHVGGSTIQLAGLSGKILFKVFAIVGGIVGFEAIGQGYILGYISGKFLAIFIVFKPHLIITYNRRKGIAGRPRELQAFCAFILESKACSGLLAGGIGLYANCFLCHWLLQRLYLLQFVAGTCGKGYRHPSA